MPTNYDEARALAEKYVRDFNTQSEVRWLCNQFLAALGEGEERAVRAKQDATRFSIELDGAHADSERLLAALGELHDLRGSPDVLAQEIMQARSARDAALRERDEARSRLASATDLLNVYCRENSVQEAENEAGLRDGIERLALRAASYRRERDEARGIIDSTRETAVRAVASWGLATGHADTLDDLLSHAGEQVAELIAERDALAEALRLYASHGAGCPVTLDVYHWCTCGLDAALTPPRAEGGKP